MHTLIYSYINNAIYQFPWQVRLLNNLTEEYFTQNSAAFIIGVQRLDVILLAYYVYIEKKKIKYVWYFIIRYKTVINCNANSFVPRHKMGI